MHDALMLGSKWFYSIRMPMVRLLVRHIDLSSSFVARVEYQHGCYSYTRASKPMLKGLLVFPLFTKKRPKRITV
jgi:hypothetical protein